MQDASINKLTVAIFKLMAAARSRLAGCMMGESGSNAIALSVPIQTVTATECTIITAELLSLSVSLLERSLVIARLKSQHANHQSTQITLSVT